MIYFGVVENRYDPLKLGRCQVRVVGLHSHNRTELPTDDLPWAMPIQPITSAALSGIGSTPLGPVEGTWVAITFTDEANQIPIILGSLGGIPQKDFANISESGNTINIKLDGVETVTNTQASANIDKNGAISLEKQSQSIEDNKLRRASDFEPSSACVNLIKKFEGLRLKAYQDAVGIWTIGYGSTTYRGTRVIEGLTITKEEAEAELISGINSIAVPVIKRTVRSLITQSMFDALACFTYNIGGGNFSKSTLLSELNSSKYLDAAAAFLMWTKAGGRELAGLVTRRKAEKDLFLQDGVPNEAGEVQNQQSNTPSDTNQTNDTQDESSANATTAQNMVLGFTDASGKYPLYFSEPDTNRLARHEEIQKTIVYKKEASVDKEVEAADGTKWDQSPIPYNAQYPFNHVYQTESGHVMEFDDTPNSERIHLYHKSGTFTEIDANGTEVHRIVGDGYTIMERNGFVHIRGKLNITVDGSSNVIIKNGLNVNVHGTTNVNIYNDTNLNVSGSLNVAVKENFNLKAAAVKIEATSFDLNSTGGLNMQAGGVTNINSGGNIYMEAPKVFAASGAGTAAKSGLSSPADRKDTEEPEFNKLTVITREAHAASHYETPEEGDPTEYQNSQIKTGAIQKENVGSGEEVESATPAENKQKPLDASCDAIYKMSSFDPSMPLSKNFTLSGLTSRGTRMPVAQVGLSAQAIVCNLKGLCLNILEPIRDYYPNMTVTSAFRRPGDVANSSATSQHYNGEAVDIVIPNLDRKGHYEAIQKLQSILPYDQLILEYSGSKTVWIHCSFKYSGNRKQIFTMRDHKRIGEMGQFVLVV